MEELIIAIDDTTGLEATALSVTSLAAHNWLERKHLQQWVLKHPTVLGEDVTILDEEVSRWQRSDGTPVHDRLDVLGLDPDGTLVVAELKREKAPDTTHMQALNYAAMASRLRLKDLSELYAHRYTDNDTAKAETELATKFGLSDALTTRPVRMVLVASDFPVSVTQSAIWMAEQGIAISLVRFRAYKLPGGQVVVSFSRILPVPDAEDFTVRRRSALSEAAVTDDDTTSWDEPTLRELDRQGNEVTKALLDLLVESKGVPVTVVNVMDHLEVSPGSVRGQLAGLTMLLRRARNPIGPRRAPWRIAWMEGGVANYYLDDHLAVIWRRLRGLDPSMADHAGSAVSE